MSGATDDQAWEYAPAESNIYMSELAGAAPQDSAAIDLSLATQYHAGQRWTFTSSAAFYILFGDSGIAVCAPATQAAPGSESTGTCFDVPGGAHWRITITADRRYLRWQSTQANQRLRYYPSSPGGQ